MALGKGMGKVKAELESKFLWSDEDGNGRDPRARTLGKDMGKVKAELMIANRHSHGRQVKRHL